MHVHLATTQVQLKGRPGVYHQICRCGHYRQVDETKLVFVAGQWRPPYLTPRNWRLKARSVLELIEWSGWRGRHRCCPVCESIGPHREGCLIDRLLHEPNSF